ncbi:MAG: site-specific integrase [Opitutaceae bacterium]|jgi:integrase|nr:site-specific integrase [Opitutaceae bacterium]
MKSTVKNTPIVIANGSHEVKIYTVRNRGRSLFQLSWHQGGTRQRKTFARMSDARREAKLILGKLTLDAHDAAELSTADMESYLIARKHIEPTGLPLHVCAEMFAQVHPLLAGRSLKEAVEFYVSFHPGEVKPKKVSELVTEFVAGREAMGFSARHIIKLKTITKRLTASFGDRMLPQVRTAELDKWLCGLHYKGNPLVAVTKNTFRKLCVSFGNWVKEQGYLPKNLPTEFDGMMAYKEAAMKITIYTPEELRFLFETVRKENPKLLAWAACAAFTGARTSELGRLRWEHINFKRNFVEISSEKVRSKSRRLVPLQASLKAWLLTCRKESGPIVDYKIPQRALHRIMEKAGFGLRDNAFRHSYISYRVAEIGDINRVAMEAGNTPEIIFQYYREVVGPDEAQAWFGVMPAATAATAVATVAAVAAVATDATPADAVPAQDAIGPAPVPASVPENAATDTPERTKAAQVDRKGRGWKTL